MSERLEAGSPKLVISRNPCFTLVVQHDVSSTAVARLRAESWGHAGLQEYLSSRYIGEQVLMLACLSIMRLL